MELIIATHNEGKIKEFSRILEPLGITVIPQSKVCPQVNPEETGTTFAENAKIKAMACMKATGKACVADDSGLCVDYLGGEPGVYSARYGGENATDRDRYLKLLKKLEGVPQEKRTARFVSAICAVFPDGNIIECQGICEGNIGTEPLGEGGFGYDPVFMVGTQSYAQMDGKSKDIISHRGKALQEFYSLLKRGLNFADK